MQNYSGVHSQSFHCYCTYITSTLSLSGYVLDGQETFNVIVIIFVVMSYIIAAVV